MRRALIVVFLMAGMALAACGGSEGPGFGDNPPVEVDELRSNKARISTPIVSSDDAATFAHDNLAFSLDLYLELRSAKPGNFVFSQTSISTSLAMLYAGASSNTAVQMADALHFSLPAARLHAAFNALDLALTMPPPGASPSAFQLTNANSAWIQQGYSLLPVYLDTLAENYGAGLFAENFQSAPEAAREKINNWVAHRTDGEIPSLFPPGSIDTLTRLVLANAVYFHGDWKVPFLKDSPNRVFHAPSGDTSVPTMYGSKNAGIWSGPGWSAAAIDYVGDTVSMIVLVPDVGTFAAFEAGLDVGSLAAILAGTPLASGADLYLPRFEFSTEIMLNDVLSALGMPDAFGDDADFSGINGARDLRVRAVIHEANIRVDEKGTTASAATGISVGTVSAPPTLVVDRPFLFFVRHDSGAILFQGRVVDPSQ